MNEEETKTVIKAIIKQYEQTPQNEFADLSSFLAGQLYKVKCTQIEKREILQNIQTIRERALNEVKNEEKKLRNIQRLCHHYLTSWYSDPAGGNNSYTRCNICGKEW